MQKYRAVIIDDEEDSRSNTRNMLENYCTEIEIVGEAASGPEGKAKIQELKPHVVFLDINMPGMNGFQGLPAKPRPFCRDRRFCPRPARAFGETGKMRDRLCLRSSCSCAKARYSAGETRHAFRRLPQSIHRPVEWHSSIVAERARSISRARVLPRTARARGLLRPCVPHRRQRWGLRTVSKPPLRGLPGSSVRRAAAASRKSLRHRSATQAARNATASREIIPERPPVKERNPLKVIDFRRFDAQCGTTTLCYALMIFS